MRRDDESLDVFGDRGIGGATGTLLLGVFAARSVGQCLETAGGPCVEFRQLRW